MSRPFQFAAVLAFASLCFCAHAGETTGAAAYHSQIQPLLKQYCFDCHGDGARKGDVAFDGNKSDNELLADTALWAKALKMLRANLMPPAKKPRPSAAERSRLAQWIKTDIFQIDPQNPDPGRVTIRRLNNAEYRNTIRHLTGITFDTAEAFPPDDTGYGFDTIGDVLTMSPMLFEKYLTAAQKIVGQFIAEDEKRGIGHGHFFDREIPTDAAGRNDYARELLKRFASKAWRRPADAKSVERLAKLAASTYSQPGKSFQDGMAQALVAALASPKFLYLDESLEPGADKRNYPLIDEYSLASRLSYFLWSSMPDEELIRLASEGQLRKNLPAQVTRMLADKRSDNFVHDFAGQWLRARDVEDIDIEVTSVLNREREFDPATARRRDRYRELRDRPESFLTAAEKIEREQLHKEIVKRLTESQAAGLSWDVRHAMRRETEGVFGYVMRDDRRLLELLDSDYTFLNETLANYYGISNVVGHEMRRGTLPAGSPRGGVLTEGTVLIATSNPTRTSPVKRGGFVLDGILGTPTPPPPPNIPPLEESAKSNGKRLSLRDTLAMHRENPMCSSCHNRLDPMGLAFENFNAMGLWRKAELGQPIDASGTLVTGEHFKNIQQLKHLLAQNHAEDFYRTLTEKMLIYALGRGLEYYDVETVDQIVARIEKSDGKSSALLTGIIESAPFQRCRRAQTAGTNNRFDTVVKAKEAVQHEQNEF